jgi:hypothetical protein
MKVAKLLKHKLLKPAVRRLKPKRNLIVVLGMHRSGTSALTEALAKSQLPIKLGEKLLGAKKENPRGFFEDVRVVKANQAFFGEFDSNYLQPWKLPDDSVNRGVERIRKVWQALEREKINLIKDPRLCVTLPQWKFAWRHDVKPVYIHIWRHPTQVAESLWRRGEVSKSVAEKNWVYHVKSALKNADLKRSVFVLHSDLIEQPHETINKVCNEISRLTGWNFSGTSVDSIDKTLVTRDVQEIFENPETKELWDALVHFNISRDPKILSTIIRDGL